MRPFMLMLALEAGRKVLPVARRSVTALAERHAPRLADKIRPTVKPPSAFERHIYRPLVTPNSKADRALRRLPGHPFVQAGKEWLIASTASRVVGTRLGRWDKVGLISAFALQHRVEALKKVGTWVAVRSTTQAGDQIKRKVSRHLRERS